MERTTNSADARRAADYLSRYCDECIGCVNCIFDIGEAAHEAHINDRIVTSTPQTLAERGMTMLGSTRVTPRIRSYLYCDAVDACFYYAGAVPSVVVTARWTADSPDIAEGSKKPQIAAEVVRRMMTAMDKAMKAEKDRQWAAYMEEQKLK